MKTLIIRVALVLGMGSAVPSFADEMSQHKHGHGEPASTASGEHPHSSKQNMKMDATPPFPQHPSDCSPMQIWDVGMAMCMPLPMAGMPMSMFMISGNITGGFITQEGPRGRSAAASTSMVMLDLGTTVGAEHYLNVDLMLTAERWTLPAFGYPLLMQTGEENQIGQPYIDAQHPHSSPIMGLTFSDTIRLAEKNALKLYFAPRGETTDGPVAFMHRATGTMNPDAPLGHHVGQDVGHITSTVLGASLKLGDTRIEASTFSGREPSPTKVDLPILTPDSGAVRLVQQFSPDFMAMASFAYVNKPEPLEPDIPHSLRYSASSYNRFAIGDTWKLHNSFILGAVTRVAHADLLGSLGEEFWFSGGASNIWGRIELLQRTPEQLNITTAPNQNLGQWVAALTLGYTHFLARYEGAQLGLGGSVTKNFVPNDFATAYGGNPWSAKVFLQIRGMRMWDL